MSWITTITGKHFNFRDIQPESICIEDIATALSNICRFTGHVPDFYSVAQHSVLVSELVPPEFAFEALMHDAAEAYCSDVNSPLKSILPDYRAVIGRVEKAIAEKFNLPPAMSDPVKHADLVMLATERQEFGLDDGTRWPILDGIDPAPMFITPLSPRQALVRFMQRYNELRAVEVLKIKPMEVKRDQYGYWTHPDYAAFCDGREYVPNEEFNQWMASQGLEWTVVYRDEDEIDPAVDGYDISSWQPESPDGDGWFVGSIHDTEDGAVCIWLRAGEQGGGNV